MNKLRDLIDQIAKALADNPDAAQVKELREALAALILEGGKGFVVFRDLEDFCPYKGADGGQYAYFTRYCPQGNGWRVEYDTSADFPYCPIYGQFQECWNCPDREWDDLEGGYKCVAPFEVVSDAELADEIRLVLQRGYHVFVMIDKGVVKVIIESRSLCEACSQCG